MSTPGGLNNLLLASAGGGAAGYEIERSLRFNSSDSAYLGATFGTPTDQDVFTLSMWVKRSALGSTQHLFGVSTNHSFGFTSGDALNLTFGGSSALTTTALFRDPSAWYHIVWTQNGTSHTIYVNNVSVGTATATSSVFNTAVAHQIGAGNTTNYFNGYLADVHFIDGQALDPTSFTEVDATTGQLVPIKYTGTYGTNGFHLPFSDNSSAAALGTDTSGAGNDWTVNNISVAAGAGNDSLVDTPTNYGTDTGAGGEVRGNYATLNATVPLKNDVLANGNLELTTNYATASAYPLHVGTVNTPAGSGKWYWEINIGSAPTFTMIGIVDASESFDGRDGTGGAQYRGCAVYVGSNGAGYTTGVGATYSGTPYSALTAATLVGVIFDADNGTLKLSYDGVEQAVIFTGISSTTSFLPCLSGYGDNITYTFNFGQRPFAYTAPSGFKALCTANLPAPVVAKPSTVMDVKLYTGNGSTQTISGLSFSPDLVWIKERNAAADHALYDSVRGVQQQLESNTTTDETTESTGLTAFNSDGFALSSLAQVNTNTDTYVAWCWDESATAGFDIVTYTGNGSARTISHGLGVAPNMIIVKARTTASTDQGWPVYHSANTAAPATDYLLLNSPAATADLDTVWNDTAPTSSVFSVGTNALVNTNNDTYVAYLFSAVVGYSSFGSYTGNGSADGPFVYTGFRPRFILIKRSDGSGNWLMLDSIRLGYNASNNVIQANLVNAEGAYNYCNILSNGFKIQGTDASGNTSGSTYVYYAVAEHPFQYARAR